MKKYIKIRKDQKELEYVYRIASVSLDKVTLEKHRPIIRDPFDREGILYEINDDTRVGTVTQKMANELVPSLSKDVDEILMDFKMDDKKMTEVIYTDEHINRKLVMCTGNS